MLVKRPHNRLYCVRLAGEVYSVYNKHNMYARRRLQNEEPTTTF